jgi:hypothetical protein
LFSLLTVFRHVSANSLGPSFNTLSILSFLHGFDLRQASTNRLAIATFWRTFHLDGKFSPEPSMVRLWGVHALPIALYHELWCLLQLSGKIHSPRISLPLFSPLWFDLEMHPCIEFTENVYTALHDISYFM